MNLLTYLFQVTLCTAVFYAFYYFALKRETLFEVNRFYLLLTMILSLVLPFTQLNFAQEVVQSGLMPSVVFLETTFVTLSDNLSTASMIPLDLGDILLLLYIIGVLFMAIRLLTAYRHIHRIKVYGTAVIIRDKQCVLSDQVKSPFSFFNTIYLPRHHQYSKEALAEVIAHENAHIRERHSGDVLLLELITMVCWINPFIYLYKHSLSDVHEYIADKAVLKFSHWENYAQLLVQQQYKQLPNALSHQLIYSQLKNRLRMMTRQPSGITARLKYLGILPVLMITLILLSFKSREALTSTHTNSAIGIKIDGEERALPVFPGCNEVAASEQMLCTSTKLNEYISTNLVFPKSLEKEGIEGKVIAKFIVGNDGKVKDVTIVKSLQADADLAVLALLLTMNENIGQWIPATKEGKAVDAEMHLPVVFALADKK